MKLFQYIIIQLVALNVGAQIQELPEIADPFDRAIHEFNKPFEEQEFSISIALLEDLKIKYPESRDLSKNQNN